MIRVHHVICTGTARPKVRKVVVARREAFFFLLLFCCVTQNEIKRWSFKGEAWVWACWFTPDKLLRVDRCYALWGVCSSPRLCLGLAVVIDRQCSCFSFFDKDPIYVFPPLIWWPKLQPPTFPSCSCATFCYHNENPMNCWRLWFLHIGGVVFTALRCCVFWSREKGVLAPSWLLRFFFLVKHVHPSPRCVPPW